MKKLTIVLLGIGLLFGCQKLEVDPDFTGQPVFKANLIVDGESKTLVAGDDNYYLFTGKETIGGATEFYGNLKDENCSDDCPPELKISFKSNDIQSLFEKSFVDFEESTNTVKPLVKVRFDAAPHGVSPFENTWLFEDGTTLTGDHIFKEFEANTTGTVQLRTVSGDGCENMQERTIKFEDFPDSNTAGCEDYFFFIDSQPDSSGFTNGIFIIPIGVESLVSPDSLVWQNDNSSDLFFCFHPDSIPSEICVDIVNLNSGCPQETICLSLQDNNSTPDQSFCSTQFSYTDEIIFVPSSVSNEESVVVEYIQDDKTFYSSVLTQNGAQFQIKSFENYEANEKGNPTIKYTASFTCSLSTLSGEIIEIEAQEVVLAVEQ